MQVQQWAGLWTQLTAPWLEGRGDGSRWPETAKWPVCDPEHIPSHGLLVRALEVYWASGDID